MGKGEGCLTADLWIVLVWVSGGRRPFAADRAKVRGAVRWRGGLCSAGAPPSGWLPSLLGPSCSAPPRHARGLAGRPACLRCVVRRLGRSGRCRNGGQVAGRLTGDPVESGQGGAVAARHMRKLRPGLGRASPVILGKLFCSPKMKSNSCLLICQSSYEVRVSLTKSDGCGKNNDCSALGPGLRYFESHEPPLRWRSALLYAGPARCRRVRRETRRRWYGGAPVSAVSVAPSAGGLLHGATPAVRLVSCAPRWRPSCCLPNASSTWPSSGASGTRRSTGEPTCGRWRACVMLDYFRLGGDARPLVCPAGRGRRAGDLREQR